MTPAPADETARAVVPPEQIRQRWCADAAAWAKWEPYFASSSWPVTLRLIAALKLSPGMRVLDVGCGIGDPSLQIAAMLGPTGRVLGIDLADGMVETARTRARALQLTNAAFEVMAVDELDESNDRFDAVSARFSIMFFPDVLDGLRKLRHVLKPRGRIAVSTWASHDVNPMFDIPRRRLAEVAEVGAPPGDAPGPLRLAKEGLLESALHKAGFSEIDVCDVVMYNFARSPEEYFEWVRDLSASFRELFDALQEDQQQHVRLGMMEDVAKYADSGGVRVPAQARLGRAVARES